MPRATTPKGKSRHDPLHVQIGEDETYSKFGRVSANKRGKKRKSENEEELETALDARTSRKIFDLAKDQQEELDLVDDEGSERDTDEVDSDEQLNVSRVARDPTTQESDDEDENEYPEEEYEELEIDPEDMTALDALMPSNAETRKTLADMIMEKLNAAEAATEGTEIKKIRISTNPNSQEAGPPNPAAGLNPKVVEVYTRVGQLLNHYKSGPLPKPFKVLPSLPQWARLLALTKPHEWTPHAHYAATRMLVSNLKPESVRHYLEGVLLEAVRDDIRINGKLNVHLYDALKKAVYKPAAFFKGIVFPLCETGCTLKEAVIVASVLMKVSVPNLHSAAALLRLASMDYSGPNSLFIRVLLDKKYALPYKVVDGLVFHFIRIANTHKGSRADGDKLPVLWHQSLLVFCQRYASDLSPDQKDALLDVIRARPHAQIGPEIRRELVNAASKSIQRDNDVEMH
ncbi:Bystin [Bos taurus] [Rhizoctonia solani]|uniref:Bystin [Bos taurus] n=1 Tax=Rhizoctonia solani TaxID=456999 RepID=A0A0K6FT31_9AGAM|nr:Bystin [Bos taurus] [Rhizoctonia solani]